MTKFVRCITENAHHLPTTHRSKAKAASLGLSKTLQVHDVGNYKVSVAPDLKDLRRVDTSVFTLAPGIDKLLADAYGKNSPSLCVASRTNRSKTVSNQQVIQIATLSLNLNNVVLYEYKTSLLTQRCDRIYERRPRQRSMLKTMRFFS